jgi:hypothetical protein
MEGLKEENCGDKFGMRFVRVISTLIFEVNLALSRGCRGDIFVKAARIGLYTTCWKLISRYGAAFWLLWDSDWSRLVLVGSS